MPKISQAIRRKVFTRAHNACEYCQTQQLLIGMPLAIDHVLPTSAGGKDRVENLAAACYRCNQFKGARLYATDSTSGKEIALFNPRTQRWSKHFSWIQAGLYVEGKTLVGRASTDTLQLNNEYIIKSRRIWIDDGWHPPKLI